MEKLKHSNLLKSLKRLLVNLFLFTFELLLLPILVVVTLAARYFKKKKQIGIGPDPLVNNIYHKRALELKGYSVETFVDQVFHVAHEFDIRADKMVSTHYLRAYYLFFRIIFHYQCIYIYFNGGALRHSVFLWRMEPYFYKLAKVKVVVTAYGADVQDFTRCPSLIFKHFMGCDYPEHKRRRGRIVKNIDLWTQHSSHVIGGCDWVDYLFHWDTLTIAHFCIDIEEFKQLSRPIQESPKKPLRILHAPNHRGIKGTKFFLQSIEELKKEGEDIELVLLERVERKIVLEEMAKADIIADQLVIGWYAMFSIEAMAMGKPVICYLRDDLIKLYQAADLLDPNEIPIINCDFTSLKETIRHYCHRREELATLGEQSKAFVNKYHSLEYMGDIFHKVNQSLEI